MTAWPINWYRAVYPRVCGGTFRSSLLLVMWRGLSPRVRGNQVGMPSLGTSEGSIPACAGEPRMPAPPGLAGEVYPRVCGGTGWFP